MKIPDMAILITAFGVLVILTNALTEVFKGILASIPVQITTTIIALILTMGSVLSYLSMTETPIEWYMIFGAFIGGFFVSYSAQFGYDKFKEITKLIGGKK